jgi:hypothetical protein
MRGRTNTTTTTTSKTSVSTSKQIGGRPRFNSGATGTSSGIASTITGINQQKSNYSRSLKLITEVDGIFQKPKKDLI